ncbi:MAG TPA: L-lactate permease [Candidatus Coprenecus avistercoris]|uniref:L-lactate permease n=1 Tax=Candidatus Coprenecus avistercoris TaxID=2840730 RepID=A0A9D1J6Q5_9BACT|nr:L-lactate permease [Candidatus Coprenecus avistercoris]
MDVLLALLPILTLIVLMGVFKVPGDRSSLITLIVTIVIAVWYFGQPLQQTGLSFFYGALKALVPILLIILMAIYSYNVLLHTGKIEVLKAQFSSISSNKCIQVLLITWGFGGLLEGMAGFGTAVAIPAAILISLGFKPVFSALVSLIANSVPTAFGAVGVPVIVLAQETSLDVMKVAPAVVAQLAVTMILVPIVIAQLTVPGKKALPRNILIGTVIGAVSLAVQYLAARYIGPETPAILGSVAAIAVIILLGRILDRRTARNSGTNTTPSTHRHSTKEILQAWAVYALIMLLILLTSPLLPLKDILAPVAETSIGFNIGGETRTWSVQWLVQGGLLLFIGSFAGGLLQGGKAGGLLRLLWKSTVQLKKTFITVICLVGFSSIMETSGMINTLAVALATATGALYPLFAPAIGAIGTFLTGSDTSANILFGKLQAGVAEHIGADPVWISASNTAGATGGKIISPQSIAIATSACGQQGQEGRILKAALLYAIGYVVITGIVVYIFAY